MARARPNVPYWKDVEHILGQAWNDIVINGMDVEQRLNFYAAEIEKARQAAPGPQPAPLATKTPVGAGASQRSEETGEAWCYYAEAVTALWDVLKEGCSLCLGLKVYCLEDKLKWHEQLKASWEENCPLHSEPSRSDSLDEWCEIGEGLSEVSSAFCPREPQLAKKFVDWEKHYCQLP